MADERVRTGVSGLDDVVSGGLIRGHSYLVSGAPGTGKSVLCLQFIVRGAQDFGEPGLYITVEESADDVRDYGRRLGLPVDALEKAGKVVIVEQPVLKGSAVSMEFIEKLIEDNGVKRVVLDSITLFEYLHGGRELSMKRDVLKFMDLMKKRGVTLMATAERSHADVDRLVYSMEDFLFDGLVLLLRLRCESGFEHALTVLKMRGVSHSMGIHPVVISGGGISLTGSRKDLKGGKVK
ncbi:Circadian clock protein kinase KaiC [uncultured archaeon]|nr:Circadian clock protein kinase KaiC [uncultured archaeon]